MLTPEGAFKTEELVNKSKSADKLMKSVIQRTDERRNTTLAGLTKCLKTGKHEKCVIILAF